MRAGRCYKHCQRNILPCRIAGMFSGMFQCFLCLLWFCVNAVTVSGGMRMSSFFCRYGIKTCSTMPSTIQRTLCFSKAPMQPILYRTRHFPHIARIDKADLHVFKHIWSWLNTKCLPLRYSGEKCNQKWTNLSGRKMFWLSMYSSAFGDTVQILIRDYSKRF